MVMMNLYEHGKSRRRKDMNRKWMFESEELRNGKQVKESRGEEILFNLTVVLAIKRNKSVSHK